MSGQRGKQADVVIKRIYEAPAASDGQRVLVDRLWPRGVSKARAKLDAWLKAIAPSDELRDWFGHDPEKWDEARRRYFAELDANAEAVAELRAMLAKGRVTLLYAARDTQHNNAQALLEYLTGKRA
ncbi:DUF488 domain-containing protein [Luteimonas sp. e5]